MTIRTDQVNALEGVDERTLFRSLFGAYPDALLVVNQAGVIVLANEAAASLLQYEASELVGQNVDALVGDHIRPRHAAYRESYAKDPRPRPMGNQMDLLAKRKDGSEVMVEIALSPLQRSGLPFVVASIRDIGAYPRVKQALQQARYSEHVSRFGRLAVDARDPMVLVDQVPLIAAEALQVEGSLVVLLDDERTAFRIASAVGLLPGEKLGDRMTNRPDTPAGYLYVKGQSVVVDDFGSERRFQVPPALLGYGLKSALACPLSDKGRVIGALSVRSRVPRRFGTEEIRFLEALSNILASSLQRANTEEALNHAQRLESVGQLTGGLAHDFNNLLTVIQGNLQVLEEHPPIRDDPHALMWVGAATRAARRGAELTSKLLAFSRRQVLQPSAVDIRSMLRALADMLTRTFDQRIHIDWQVAADCPGAQADPGQLESALLNIAINARDAMPDGGTLRFRADRCVSLPAGLHGELDEPPPAQRPFVAIVITDTGSGMSEAVKEKAFEPFFTTKEVGRGTGLGLSTVYGFVRQSNGAVTIESTPGAGTAITMYLPAHDAPHATSREPAPDTSRDGVHDVIPAGLRVLLVEDDVEVRTIIETFLKGLGCDLAGTAASAEQALLMLQSMHDVQLLLTDIALGAGLRGTELARQVQASVPGIAILLMSGFSEELLDADRDSPPSWGLLPKPCTRQDLGRAIARALATRDA